MHSKRRYRYLFALLFLISCITLGILPKAKFSIPFQQDNQIATTRLGVVACPCSLHIRATACPCPTPTQPNLDMTSGARLLIPALGVDAPIEPVGVLSNGALNVPQKNPWVGVGWYKDGPVPGQLGSAVIDGHLDRPRGVPAVFWNLHQLHRGDTVTIVAPQAEALHFHVLHLQAYQPDKAPLDKIYADTSGRYLNLITCAGSWIPSQHQTAKRLVVYTQMVPP
jgi:LPXTG-site transpeptidase (sortase) family protein